MNHAGMIDEFTERTLLGAMLLEEDALVAGLELEPTVFGLDSHRRIFTRMRVMREAGFAIDTSTMVPSLLQSKELDTVGGPAYIAFLTEGIPRHLHVGSYIRVLLGHARRRRIAQLCLVAQSQLDEGHDPEDVWQTMLTAGGEAQRLMTDIRPRHVAEFVVPFLEQLAEQRKRTSTVVGIATGISDLDETMTGWRNGELTYVGALPGRGKTAFLLQCMYAAATAGVGVGCISLEMRASQLLSRLAIRHSAVHPNKLRDARRMDEAEYRAVQKAGYELADLPIHITDQSGLRASQIASQARQMYDAGARLIFVDFVQIIAEDGKDRREAINRVSASLRDTCKALDIPFVVASQLARRDADENRRPTMQDLRESGNLEQDAHTVLMLYRPKDKATKEWTGEDLILIEKAREGVTGHVEVSYDERRLMFTDRRRDAPRPQLVRA